MSVVLVVGAGPVGLTMAAELARHGVRARIIDAKPAPLPFCRAIGVTSRTLEVWDDMGIANEMIDRGIWLEGMRIVIQGVGSQDALQDLSSLPYSELGLPQYETEAILTRRLEGFGVSVERGIALKQISQTNDEVQATLTRTDGSEETCYFQYVVGCDGAHSTVRRQLGIAFDGEAFPYIFMLGDVRIDWDLPRGIALRAMKLIEDDAPKMFIAIPLPERNRYRVSMRAPDELVTSQGTDHGIQSELPSPSVEHLQRVADELVEGQPKLQDLRWSSIFRISMRLASAYQNGRCFIAGDAAHIHPPTGGQGMNTGIQDAYNLAWKLALVMKGASPAQLLDSYGLERRPVGADVIQRTQAATLAMASKQALSPEHPLTNTQVLINYRGSEWIQKADGPDPTLQAGDRLPDANNLYRHNVMFPYRLFDIIRGTEHVLIVHLDEIGHQERDEFEAFAKDLKHSIGEFVRVVVITSNSSVSIEFAEIPVYEDRGGAMTAMLGSDPSTLLVRPDGYLAWRGVSWKDAELMMYLKRVFPNFR